MRLGVLALDYDGTIAEDGVLTPEVGKAIREARAGGVVVVLVTGRMLDDLRWALGDLGLVDAVVAENGAVLAFPDSDRCILLGKPPPSEFVDELRRAGVNAAPGMCLVDTDAEAAPIVLRVIRERQLPLVLVFNRGRLMVLPQGISKATGLRQALRALRLSEHNAIGIGDAENDHALLEACELGVAVSWGSPTLKQMADDVLQGAGPPAVADYIRQAVAQVRLAPEKTGRRRLVIGTAADQEPVALKVRGRNVLVAGDPRSGKSWIAGLLAEQLILQGYSVCVLDPEGDYRPLLGLPGVLALGGPGPAPRPHEVMRALRYPDASVVVDLSGMPHADKGQYVRSLLYLLRAVRRRTGLPHRIVLDEAHYFLNEGDLSQTLDLELAGYTLVTYRLAQIPPAALAASRTAIITRLTEPQELAALGHLGPHVRGSEKLLASLSVGDAVLWPSVEEAHGRPLRFQVAPRLTRHVRHRQKYLDIPVPEQHAFVFTRGGSCVATARTLKAFTRELARCPGRVIDAHLARGDVSRWVADVFGDHILAGEIRQLERLHRPHEGADVLGALRHVIDDRYTLLTEEDALDV